MAHNLDINEGVASFASAREAAWHQLGTVTDEAMTAQEALAAAHLAGWNIRKVPLFAVDPETGNSMEVPGRSAVIRDNPVIADQTDVLGDVGSAYKVVQNEELTELLDTLVDESGAHFETAGAIEGGRRVFVTMKLPGHIKIGGVDPVDNYLAAITSHDGSLATTGMVTPVRIVCQNTLNVAFQDHSHMFRVRHTRGASKLLIAEARKALDFSFEYLEGFQEQAEILINTTLTQSRFEEIIAAEFGAEEGAAAATKTRTDRKLEEMVELFAEAGTQQGIRDTAWAGFNALTEWNDHFSPARGDDRETTRAIKAILDPSFKNRALSLMLKEAGV